MEIDWTLPHVIHEDEHIIALYKPCSYYVHPPESKFAKQRAGRNTCIHWLEDVHKVYANPIHRLDFATEGIVIFAKTRDANQKMNLMMRAKEFSKYYDAIVRGWFKEPYGKIELPLESDSSGELVECTTLYSTAHTFEVATSVHSKHPTSRYSWLDIELQTGRWHQIRRHMNRVAHPVIGDREHGDSHHNRFWRDEMKIDGLCLKAKRIVFTHPMENKTMDIVCPVSAKWQLLRTLFQT